ncbi:MAG: fibronectin type III domain-containing protein, partial [Nocardioides sp.]
MHIHTSPTRLGWCLLATTLLVAGVQGLPSSASAAPGAPQNLTSTDTDQSTIPVLSWSRPSGATSFEVQVDDDPSFESPEWTSTTVNARAVPTKFLRPGTQSWRVRAEDSKGNPGAWASADFTVSATEAPVPMSPVDGAQLQQPQDPPLLSWSAVPGATSYLVWIDTEAGFTSATPFTTKATSLVVPTNQVADTYYWQVQATRGTGVVTDWSATSSYTVLPISVPTVTAPANGQDVEDVVLHWDPVPGAKWYELQVDDDSDFQTPVTGVAPQKVFGTTYSPKVTIPNDQFFWR